VALAQSTSKLAAYAELEQVVQVVMILSLALMGSVGTVLQEIQRWLYAAQLAISMLTVAVSIGWETSATIERAQPVLNSRMQIAIVTQRGKLHHPQLRPRRPHSRTQAETVGLPVVADQAHVNGVVPRELAARRDGRPTLWSAEGQAAARGTSVLSCSPRQRRHLCPPQCRQRRQRSLLRRLPVSRAMCPVAPYATLVPQALQDPLAHQVHLVRRSSKWFCIHESDTVGWMVLPSAA